MKNLKRIIAWFFWGGLAGAIIGAIGGLFDRGSMFILVPSGSLVWAIFGALVGSIVGALAGMFAGLAAIIRSSSKQPKPEANRETLNNKND